MPFTNPDFAGNARLRRAANNSPAMSRGEKDEDAVRILQHALVGVGAATMRRSIRRDGTLDGDYGSETVRGVKRFQEMAGLVSSKGKGDGIAGRNTLRELDLRAPNPAVPLSITSGPQVTPRAETLQTLGHSGGVGIPTASALLREYQEFRDVRGKPCKASWTNIRNQCAIRMTVALGRCDIGFHLDSAHLKVHSGRKCQVDTPHDASASRVFKHLQTIWTFQHFTKSGPGSKSESEIHASVKGKKGIIYWENCFSGGASVGGDHIDYWDGELMMNDRLNYNGPGERTPGQVNDSGRFFHSMKKQCWFLPIPA